MIKYAFFCMFLMFKYKKIYLQNLHLDNNRSRGLLVLYQKYIMGKKGGFLALFSSTLLSSMYHFQSRFLKKMHVENVSPFGFGPFEW